jgi:hypothetical protein
MHATVCIRNHATAELVLCVSTKHQTTLVRCTGHRQRSKAALRGWTRSCGCASGWSCWGTPSGGTYQRWMAVFRKDECLHAIACNLIPDLPADAVAVAAAAWEVQRQQDGAALLGGCARVLDLHGLLLDAGFLISAHCLPGEACWKPLVWCHIQFCTPPHMRL